MESENVKIKSFTDLNALYVASDDDAVAKRINDTLANYIGLYGNMGFVGIDKEMDFVNDAFKEGAYLDDFWQEILLMTPVLNRNNVLVMRMNTMQFGGGSPQHFNYYLTFDLETGRKFELKDLLKPGYLQYLVPVFIESLKISNFDFPIEFSLDDFTISENFYLQTEGLYLVYRGDEIGAPMQEIVVRIPYEYLKDFIIPGSLIGRIVVNY
jgi:hypothetical protein